MKASRFFIGTLKEAPADAEIVSHKLMVRAGMIRRVAGGIYNYLPIGLRSIRKVEAIVREEMNRAGGIELLMPSVQPAELWQESGRWEKYGPELLRFKDRKGGYTRIVKRHERRLGDAGVTAFLELLKEGETQHRAKPRGTPAPAPEVKPEVKEEKPESTSSEPASGETK